MKHVVFLAIACLLLSSCDKQEAKPEPKATAASAKKASVPEKKMPPVPQGKLPQMDPEKAKFIAVPSTPKEPEMKKAAKPQDEVKKAAKPATGTTK